MLDDPGLDASEIAATVRRDYGIEAATLRFLPSHDLGAASYELAGADGRFFLKIRFGPADEGSLEVPRALLEAGVGNILAPLRTRDGLLWTAMGDRSLTLHPFVVGRSAVQVGLSDEAWRTFGATLRAVHDSGLERAFADRLHREEFALPSAAAMRQVLAQAERPAIESTAGDRLARFLRDRAGRIGEMLARASELGTRLADRPFGRVLCHADIHAANILVADDDRIFLVDWDGPMLAPRERDLLFVIGSRIARRVLPAEEALFFEGYGAWDWDPEAVVFFRYERILEDMAVDGASVFGDASLPDATRLAQVELIESFFAPGNTLDSAETI